MLTANDAHMISSNARLVTQVEDEIKKAASDGQFNVIIRLPLLFGYDSDVAMLERQHYVMKLFNSEPYKYNVSKFKEKPHTIGFGVSNEDEDTREYVYIRISWH